MSIDAAKVAEKYDRDGEEDLNEEERRFLQDRGVKLSEPVPVVFKTTGGQIVTNDAMAMYANMQEQQKVDLETEIEKRVEARLAQMAEQELRNAQHQMVVGNTPHTGTANPNVHPTGTSINPSPDELDDEDEDEDEADEGEEDYDEGWNNDTRRAELADRGLSVEGTKKELIDRLLESDREKNDNS